MLTPKLTVYFSSKIFAFITLFLCILFAPNVLANYTQDDSLGFFLVDFNGNQQGLEPVGPFRNNVTINTLPGTATLSSPNPGYVSTSTVSPASFTAWDKVELAGNWASTSAVSVTLLDCSSTPTPISGFTNMPLVGTSVNISSLNKVTYPCVRAQINMNPEDPSPVLDSVKVSWDPLPVFLITNSCNPTVKVGDQLSVTINYSVSYAEDNGVIVWSELPTVAAGTVTNFTGAYGQSINPTFVSANNGGMYTSVAMTISGINVPANSVYWNLGVVAAGTTAQVSYVLQTQNGWEDDIKYSFFSHIDSLAAELKNTDTNTSLAGNQACISTLNSTPNPYINKSVTGVIRLNNENFVYNGGSYTPVVTYNIHIRNTFASPERETIFNPYVKDDVSDILNELQNKCGVSSPASRITPLGGGLLVGNIITWDIVDMGPGYETNLNYTVDYTGCPSSSANGDYKADNTACLSGDNIANTCDSESVKFDIIPTTTGAFAKGDKVQGQSMINAGNDDNFPPLISATSNLWRQPYGDNFSYLLYTVNTGTNRLGNIVMGDKIPTGIEFVAGSLPSNVTGTIYYNTGFAADPAGVLPDYNASTGVFGGTWTTTLPSPASSVQWIAFRVNCLNSPFFPAPATGDSCSGAPVNVTAEIQAKISNPVAPDTFCSDKDINNVGVFAAYSTTNSFTNNDASVVPMASPLTYVDTAEYTHVRPSLADFSVNSSVAGPSELNVYDTGSFSVNIANTGQDTAVNPVVRIDIPKVMVNGVLTPVDFVNASGGTLDISNLPDYILVSLASIPVGQTRTVNFQLNIPSGIIDGSTMPINVQVNATDDLDCSPIVHNLTKNVNLHGTPNVEIYKSRDESVIPTAGDIHYSITYNNVGQVPTLQTFIVDVIPSKTIFKQAYTTGTDSNSNTYTCTGCQVYFSQNIPLLPAGLTPLDPLNVTDIITNFSLGTEVSPGVWDSPFGTNTKYVAWLIDNTNDLLPTNAMGNVGLTVTNDDDGSGSSTNGSLPGTNIYNNSAVFSSQLLQAISNQVVTTILPDPGLKLNKYSDKDIVAAGEEFNWFIDYKNDSGNSDDVVTITDTLPAGLVLLDIYHTWNTTAIGNGATPTVETDINPNPAVTITSNLDGTTTISFVISATLRAGDLRNNEGGLIRFNVKSLSSAVTNTTFINTVVGCYKNSAIEVEYCVQDEDPVLVKNPDLWIRKNVSNTAPLSGENVDYTLIVSNEGEHDAPNVKITDVLPAGLCYVPGSTAVLPLGWTLGEPTSVTPSVCDPNVPQTIVWDNVITGPSPLVVGTLPGNSVDIFVKYTVNVNTAVPAGTNLLNGASISTTLTEDPTYPNTDSEPVQVPYPDPYVMKNAPLVVLPGQTFAYAFIYGNNSRQPANEVYLIDTLPDFNNDGLVDVEFVSMAGSNGETFYYHAGPVSATAPTFTYSSPTSNGWTSTPGTDVAYIAIVKGSLPGLAGPFPLTLTVKAKTPSTGALSPAGVTLLNKVTVYLLETDDNPNNNTDDADPKTPGLDLAIEKTADKFGAYPGVQPGDGITYTIKFENSGTVNACAVKITDTLPSSVLALTPLHNFNNLVLTDSLGNTVNPVDSNGNAITTTIGITYTSLGSGVHEWQLGSSSTTPYTNVCLLPGQMSEFQIFVKVDPATADSTQLVNTVHIGEDSSANEDIMTNNDDSIDVWVYRADVVSSKNGVNCGADEICGTTDDDQVDVNPGQTIQYTINYNNIGNISANNAIITENIPVGSCFKVGSLTPPGGSAVEYSLNNGSTWSSAYSPVADANGLDCAITNFRIVFASPLLAPANMDGEETVADFAPNSFSGTATSPILTNGAVTLAKKAIKGGLWDYKWDSLSQDVPPQIDFTTGSDVEFIDYDSNDFPDVVVLNDYGHLISGAINLTNPLDPYDNSGSVSGNLFDILNISHPDQNAIMYDLEVGDVNGDGVNDIIFNVAEQKLQAMPPVEEYVLLSSGFGGGFNNISLGDYGNTTSVELADFNSDGIMDILYTLADYTGNCGNSVSATNVNNIVVLDPFGANTVVQLPSTSSTCYPGNDARAEDIDNDGDIDIIISSPESAGFVGKIDILKNDGTGNFSVYQNLTVPVYGFAVADFNADGFIDLAWSDSQYSATPADMHFLTNDGNGMFNPFSVTNNSGYGDYFRDLEFVDYDGDGDLDLVGAGDDAARMVVFKNDGSSNFSDDSGLIPDFWGASIEYADIDNDGDLDVAIGQEEDGGIVFGKNNLEYETSGKYVTEVNCPGLISWDKMFTVTEMPTDTDLSFDVLDATCSNVLFSGGNMSSGVANISSIPSSNTSLCLQVKFGTTNTKITPALDSWGISCKSSIQPSFTFEVKVNNPTPTTITQITNNVCISTSTPELSDTNNCGQDVLNLILADVEIKKTVDLSAINTIQIAQPTPVVYTLDYKNNGPRDANNVSIVDYLPIVFQSVPAPVITATATSGGDNVACTFDSLTYEIVCDDSANPGEFTLSPLESGSITITAYVDGTMVSDGDVFTNATIISTSTSETDYNNNDDSVNTVVGDFANVWVEKTGPTLANVGGNIVYTITYGNNGNLTAQSVNIIDDFEETTTSFVSAVQTSSTPSIPVVCGSFASGKVTCNDNGLSAVSNLALTPGATGVITITIKVNNDYSLLTSNHIFPNIVDISTITPQTNILDDHSEWEVPVWSAGLSSLSGYVFKDLDKDGIKDVSDVAIPSVMVFMSGKDIFGNILVPDKNLYPTQYNALMAELFAAGEIPSLLTASDPYPVNYFIVAPVSTDATGNYSFSGLNPGTYFVLESQPSGFVSTESNGGYLGLDINGNPALNPAVDGIGTIEGGTDENKINRIILGENQNSVHNDFGEIRGSIGNQIWTDTNANGIFDGTELGIPGVEVTLYIDVNGDGMLDSGDTVKSVIMTGANGTYMFNDLPLDTKYIVKVTDINNVLMSMVNVLGTPNTDNNGQNPDEYSISLVSTNGYTGIDNLTADFGYRILPDPKVTKLADNSVIAIGENVTYRITVMNNATTALHTVGQINQSDALTVTDNLPAELQYVSATGTDWVCNYNQPTLSCTWNGAYPILAGTTLPEIVLVAKVLGEGPMNSIDMVNGCGQVVGQTDAGQILNTAEVSVTEEDPLWICDNEEPEVIIPKVAEIDLELVKAVSVSEVKLGQAFSYTLTIVNKGPDTGTNIKVTDVLPVELNYVSSLPAGEYASDVWNVGTLTIGQSKTLTIQVTVDANTIVPSTILNTAEITSADQTDVDSTPNNNVSTEDDISSIPVNIVDTMIDLELSKKIVAPQTTYYANGSLDYELTVVNKGPDTGTNIKVTDVLPTGLTYVSSLPAGEYVSNVWNVGTLAMGESKTLTIKVTINANVTAPSTILNTAEITSADQTDVDSTPNNNVSTEDDIGSVAISVGVYTVDLELTKKIVDAKSVYSLNDILEYEISITNKGPNTANNVTVVERPGNGLAYVSDNSNGAYNNGTKIWSVGSLALNETKTIKIKFKLVSTTESLNNEVEVQSVDEKDVDSTPSNMIKGEDDISSVSVEITVLAETGASINFSILIIDVLSLIGIYFVYAKNKRSKIFA